MDPVILKEVTLFIAGLVIGVPTSWIITHRYYVKSGSDQKAALNDLASVLQSGNTLERFEALFRNSHWTKLLIENRETWVCNLDNTFQIVQGDRERGFNEPWTDSLPDPNASVYQVCLKIGATIIKELHFISADGARIFVVMPEIGLDSHRGRYFFWNKDGIGVLVTNIVGNFYIYETLDGFAARSHIDIVESHI